MRPGKRFEAEISKALRALNDNIAGFFSMRILDQARPGIRVPADFLAVYKGKPTFLECKTSKRTSFPFEKIWKTQVEDLGAAARAGASVWFLVEHRISARERELFAIPYWFWLNLLREGKRKSAQWGRLRDEAVVYNLPKADYFGEKIWRVDRILLQ